MRKIKRPLAFAGLIFFISDILMMIAGPGISVPAVLILIVITAFFTARKSEFALVLLTAVILSAVSGVLFNINNLFVLKTFELSGRNLSVTGILSDYPVITEENRSKFILTDYEINGVKGYGKIVLYSEQISEGVPGDTLSFEADEIKPAVHEGIYKFHKLSKREYLSGFSDSPAAVTSAENRSLIYRIADLREKVNNKISSAMEKNEADISKALITGDKNELDPLISRNFRISGAAHIFAVSGMHLAIWTGIFFIILKNRSKVKIIPNAAASLFVIFYMAFTGFSPSVIRAGIMLLTVFTGAMIKRKADPVNSLGLAALIQLAVNPFSAGNISFLLSFCATFALVGFYPEIKQSHEHKKRSFFIKTAVNIKTTLLISFSVLFLLLPMSAVFFGYISLLSPLSSLMLTPLAELVMLTGGAGIILPGKFGIYALEGCEFFAGLIIKITDIFKDFDFALFPLDKKIILPWFILCLTAAIIIYRFSGNRNKSLLISVLSGSLVLIIFTMIWSFSVRGDMILYFPSSGDNTSFCAVSESGSSSFIYGTGGDYSSCRSTTDILTEHTAIIPDYIIVPRSKETENKNTEYFINKTGVSEILYLYDEEQNSEYLFEGRLSENTDIYSETSDDFAASVININGEKLVVCTLPSSDFTDADEIYKNGDYLICRSKIPESLSVDNFSNIIIMSSYPYKGNDSRIKSTADQDITITIKGENNAHN